MTSKFISHLIPPRSNQTIVITTGSNRPINLWSHIVNRTLNKPLYWFTIDAIILPVTTIWTRFNTIFGCHFRRTSRYTCRTNTKTAPRFDSFDRFVNLLDHQVNLMSTPITTTKVIRVICQIEHFIILIQIT